MVKRRSGTGTRAVATTNPTSALVRGLDEGMEHQLRFVCSAADRWLQAGRGLGSSQSEALGGVGTGVARFTLSNIAEELHKVSLGAVSAARSTCGVSPG